MSPAHIADLAATPQADTPPTPQTWLALAKVLEAALQRHYPSGHPGHVPLRVAANSLRNLYGAVS